MSTKTVTLGLLALCSLLTAGCVEKKLTINTEPQGAQVFLNDEEIGTSPVTVAFQWYGDYNIRIIKQDYETIKTNKNLKAPLHDYFPFDFFADNLWPGKIVDQYDWSFKLEPYQAPSREELLGTAESVRQEAIYELE